MRWNSETCDLSGDRPIGTFTQEGGRHDRWKNAVVNGSCFRVAGCLAKPQKTTDAYLYSHSLVPISYLTSWVILEFLYLDGSPSWHATGTSETLLQHLYIYYAERICLQFEPESAETSTGIYASTHLSNNCILLVGSGGLYLETPQLEGSLSLSSSKLGALGSLFNVPLQYPSPPFAGYLWIFHDIPRFMPCKDRGPRSHPWAQGAPPRWLQPLHLAADSSHHLDAIDKSGLSPQKSVAQAPTNMGGTIKKSWMLVSSLGGRIIYLLLTLIRNESICNCPNMTITVNTYTSTTHHQSFTVTMIHISHLL